MTRDRLHSIYRHMVVPEPGTHLLERDRLLLTFLSIELSADFE